MYFSIDVFRNQTKLLLMILLLFFSLILRFLCGYEFITTIFFATCVPIFYQGILQNFTIFEILKKFFFMGLVFVIAFSSSVILHSKSMDQQMLSRDNPILSAAKKRLWGDHSPDVIAKNSCNQDQSCEGEIHKSFATNTILVIPKYTLMVDFLPWFYSNKIEKKKLNKIKKNIKSVNKDLNFHTIKVFFKETYEILSFDVIIFILIKLISLISFLFFIFYTIYIFFHTKKSFKFLILISLLGPLSWFIIAMEHSAAHLHINFVLWYISFIPCSLLAIINYHKNKSNK